MLLLKQFIFYRKFLGKKAPYSLSIASNYFLSIFVCLVNVLIFFPFFFPFSFFLFSFLR